MRQLIKRIIKEETEQDLSPAIKELLEASVVPNYKDTICQISVIPPWKRGPFITNSNFEEYEIMVRVVGGVGSKKWPETQFVHRERDEIAYHIRQTVNDYLGVPSNVFLRYVKSCKELMGESIVSNTIKRRANQQTLEKYITDGEINYPTLCDDFEDGYEYADAVIDYAIDKFLGEFGEDIYEQDYYSDVMDYLRNLCRDEFGKYLIDIYETTCTEEELDEQEQKESEITERCWKGYTQKGMKTMFGKKYPNCVKIKKKSVNESKMLDYLKQFLSGEVLDNYRKEKGRKEFQKLVDMAYKITAKNNPIEGMVGVLVGNIKKDMWGRSFNDENSVGVRWDFTVILKPLFTNYNPNNEPDYGERVLNFEKEFSDNIRGMGFEVISPIQHEKVKQYKIKYEWASRLDVKEI